MSHAGPAHTTPTHTTSTGPAHTTSTTPTHTTSTAPTHTTSTTPTRTTSTTTNPAPTAPTTREIYLAIFTNGSKPAHWSIFVPTTGSTTRGTLIHVVGNPAVGFTLQFKRNYDFSITTTRHQIIPLSHIDSKYIRDSTGTQLSEDTTARDQLQMQATGIAMPPKSANPFAPNVPNCQNWIADYVAHLGQMHMVDAGAQHVVATAPKVI